MSRFIYFLPQLKGPPGAEVLAELGIADRFEGRRPCSGGVSEGRGPGGVGGQLVASGDGPVMYLPAEQSWMEFPRRTSPLAIGWDPADLPGPGDLVRERILPGTPVRLADGREWVIPIARLLPQRMTYDGESYTPRPDQRYAGIWELSVRLRAEVWEPWMAYRAFVGPRSTPGGSVTVAEADQAHYAALLAALDLAQVNPADLVAILAANYRVGPEECAALGLLEMVDGVLSNAVLIIDALVDGPGIRAARAGDVAEKKDSAPS